MPNPPASGRAVEVVYDDGANVIVRKGGVFVQVRRGPMTMEAVELLAAIVRSARQTEGAMLGVLLVIEQSAPLPTAEVRVRQQALVRDLMRDGRVRAAAVIEGSGVEAMAKRSIGRLLSIGHRVEIASDVAEGAAALSRAMDGAPVHQHVHELVAEARARLDRSS